MMGRKGGEVCQLAIMPDLPFKGTNAKSRVDTDSRHGVHLKYPLQRCHYSSWGHHTDFFPSKVI